MSKSNSSLITSIFEFEEEELMPPQELARNRALESAITTARNLTKKRYDTVSKYLEQSAGRKKETAERKLAEQTNDNRLVSISIEDYD